MSLLHLVGRFLPLSLLAAVSPASSAPPPRPNLLFVMADDHAAHAIGAYGSTLRPVRAALADRAGVQPAGVIKLRLRAVP